MRKILITGGAGFIASSLAEKLIRNPDNFVVIVDDLSSGHYEKLPRLPKTNWKFFECNVNYYSTISEIIQKYRFDYIFHYAAFVGVQRTQENPIRVLQDIEGFKHIFTMAKDTGVKRVFFSSSSEVYGEPVEFPQNEHTTPLNSKLPYAIVKNLGEAFLRSYHKEFGLDYTIFRFFNTYGPKQSKQFVISKFLLQALNNEPVTLYGDGLQTRTFCHIDDNIDACMAAFEGNKIINDVVNIGGDKEITMLELAQLIIALTKSQSKIIRLPALEEGDMRRRKPDTATMKNLLQRTPIPLETGIKNIVREGLFEATYPKFDSACNYEHEQRCV